MTKTNISQECVDVFSWRRAYDMGDPQRAVAYVQRQCAKGRVFKETTGLDEASLLRGKVVLDLGCGPGLKSCQLAHYGPERVIGIDGSIPAIDAARALSDALGQRNTTFLHGFIEDAPALLQRIGITAVDFILSAQMIHHTTEWEANVERFGRLLRPGGVLQVSWLDVSSAWGAYTVKNKIAYTIGRDKASRMRIGGALFGWWDYRKHTTGVQWENFCADHYAAYYKIITVRQMVRALHRCGFEVLASSPPVDWGEWRRQASHRSVRRRGRALLAFLDAVPSLSGLATVGVRVQQFMGGGGDIRTLTCRKRSADVGS